MSSPASFDRIASEFPLSGVMTYTMKAAAFWAAVLIPAAYPVLLYAGLDGANGYLFVSLLFANALALAFGHDYKQ